MVSKMGDGIKKDCEIANEMTITDKKQHEFGEAMEIVGNGKYNIYLMGILSMAMLAMVTDMFGFSVVVAGASCDFDFDQQQKSILMSMPFAGTIITAYPWGYYSDTQGRKKALVIAMAVSWIASTVSAFSPHWIMMAVLKFISTGFCSCAQSVAYTLLGESCIERVKGTYILIMTSAMMLCPMFTFTVGYFVLNMDFSYDLGFISFIPWRVLSLIFAVPLLISLIGLSTVYESPKFLLNEGKEEEALDVLRNIFIRNKGNGNKFPVQKLILNESNAVKRKDVTFLRSLWNQTAPLFTPPLLWRSLQLYYITAVLYSTNNAFLMWFPFLSEAFFGGINEAKVDQPTGLCNMIMSRNNNTSPEVVLCSSTIDFRTSMASVGHSLSFCIINLCMCLLATRKKAVMLFLFFISGISAFLAVLIPSNLISFILYFVYQIIGLCIGLLFSYFVDLYPTSYRGMASCLAVMVARAAALGGINLVGSFIMTSFSYAFYGCGVYIFSGLVVAALLPSD